MSTNRSQALAQLDDLLPESGVGDVHPGHYRRPKAGAAASNQYGTFQVKYASEAQQRYVRSLLAERRYDLAGRWGEAIGDALRGELNKRHASDLIDYLRSCPVVEDAARTANPASAKQVSLIERLMGERVYWESEDPRADALATVAAGGTVSKTEASEAIDFLFAAPKAEAPAAAEVEIGMYRTEDGTLYRAYPNQSKTRVLAKKLVRDDESLAWSFEYVGMAKRFVRADQRMTLEEAKAFGTQFGVCCVCAATLTDPTSVAAGIGPVCGGRV